MTTAPGPSPFLSDIPRRDIAPQTLGQRIARGLLRLRGWRIAPPPDLPKYVLIAAHHTTNWDGVFMLLIRAALGLPLHFMIKASWLRGPLGPLMRGVGAIGIDRSAPHGVVGQMAQRFEAADTLIVVVAPEGTRRHVPYWKSGFYHIAQAADVPLVMGYLDYGRKEGGFGPVLPPSGDKAADMAAIRAFYAGITPCHPEKAGVVQLKPATESGG